MKFIRSVMCNDLGYSVQPGYQSETSDQSSEAESVQQYLEQPSTEKVAEIAVVLWSTAAYLNKLAKDQSNEITDLRKQLFYLFI